VPSWRLDLWGDDHVMGGRPPVLHRHRDCGGLITDRRICSRCDALVELSDVEPEPGPGPEHAVNSR